MAAKPLPDQDMLLKLLRYEPETGNLYWRERPPEMFKSGGSGREHYHRMWNSAHAGQEAFPAKMPKGARGYVQANIFKKKYLKHRIIWKMMTGEDPIEVDHIDGDRTNHRWSNLGNYILDSLNGIG